MKSINTILIANRGEIASRIIRTCRKMGIKSIAVFSEADRDSLYVQQADSAMFIGDSNPSASYLDFEKIINAAKSQRADAIHPGYGFLSENVDFARRCSAEGIIFIGPNPEAIAAMGSKSQAKTLMTKHKVPVVPGYQGDDQSDKTLEQEAIKMGFPVLLKATAGGGGKGMRIVENQKELSNAIAAAKREAHSAFGDDELIIEKYIASGRHIEFQIFGDQHGHVIHLLERECSIQRRYQKVVEESPSPVMSDELRTKMGAAAVNAAKALNYDNAGTVEFIFDDQTGDFYFLEVNTRLQVEHPVTEEITGLDLVKMQIESAQGMELTIQQAEVIGKGYAVEARLYAEDVSNNFLPVTGRIEKFDFPNVEGLRIETAIQHQSEISIFYDPMIAKIIVWDQSRQAAHRKMNYVLRHLICLGMTTNQNFLLHLFQNEDFQEGNYNTHFIQNKIDLEEVASIDPSHINLASIALTLWDWQQRENSRTILSAVPSGWRSNFYEYQQEQILFQKEKKLVEYRFENNQFHILIGEYDYEVKIRTAIDDILQLEIDGVIHHFTIIQSGSSFYIHNENFGNLSLEQQDRFPVKEQEKVKGGYDAPMPSQIIKLLVEQGQEVKTGDGLIVLSSMKMENTIYADEDGVVEEIFTTEGASVEAGFLLLKIS